MTGIDATRTSTGQAVEMLVDEDGWLVVRTPDGEILQRQRVPSRRIKMRGDTLRLSRVEYTVGSSETAARFVASLGRPARGWRGIVVRAVAVLVVFGVGFLGGLYVRDRHIDERCDTAQQVVEDASNRLEELNEVELQDASFFAAVIVEQRVITYSMDAASRCFSLADRAQAEGLLEGVRGLLIASSR